MELSFWAATDVGKKREVNEDNFLVDKKLSLFVVADGMGGHASGEVASQLAVHEFRNAVEAGKEVDRALRQGGRRTVRPQEILTMLEHAVQTAGHDDLPAGPGRAREARHGHDDLGAAHRGRPRLHRARRRQPHLHAARRPGGPAHRGSLADQRAHPARAHHQGGDRRLALQGLQERGHARGRRLRDRPGRHARLRDPARRPVPALLGRAARLPRPTSRSSTASRATTSSSCPRSSSIWPTPAAATTTSPPSSCASRAPAAAGGAADDRAEELARKVEVLRQMPLFRHLIYKEIMRVLNVTQVREYAPGEEIIKEGTPATRCSSCCAARSACTRTTRSSPTSSPARTSARWRSSIAAAALGQRHRRGALARADACQRRDFYEIIRKEPQLSVKLLWAFTQVLAERLRKTTADLSGARLEAGAAGHDRRRPVRRVDSAMCRQTTRTETDSLGDVQVPVRRAVRRADPARRRQLPRQRAAPAPPPHPRAGARSRRPPPR